MFSSNRGREVSRGRVAYRRKGHTSWKTRTIVAFCGLGSSDDDAKTPGAQILIFEDYEKPGQKPKNIIKLDSVQIESSYSSSNSSAYTSTSTSPHGSIRLSASPSSGGGSGSGVVASDSGSGTIGGNHIFSISSKGDVHEFQTETENERLNWVKMLQLLIMYPRSSIPEEPKTNPISERMRLRLEAKQYNASSAWLVYILPNEVGAKCSIIGINVLALKSGIPGKQVGTLNIYNPADPSRPVLTWDRDKTRRTGKTGNLVFVEIGRRCQGGPGLVWMYSGFNDAQALRETLHNFLFKGDGSAVPIHTHNTSLYDSPRASFDANFPPSYQRENSIGSFPSNSHSNPILSRSRSNDHDSGFVGSPGSLTSPKLEGPPVRLDKHPSFRRRRDSNPRDIRRSSSNNSPMGSFSETSVRSGDSNERIFEDEPSSGHHSRSDSPEECDGDIVGSMDPVENHSVPMYEVVPGPATSFQRVVGASEYETMIHPKANQDAMGGYVKMSKAPIVMPNHSNPMSVPQPQQSYKTIHTFQQSKPNSSNTVNTAAARNNYDTLPTIREAPKQDIYVNHPLPQDVKNAPELVYSPDYQNIELGSKSELRRGSLSKDQYENVERIKSPPKHQIPDNYVQFRPRNVPAYS